MITATNTSVRQLSFPTVVFHRHHHITVTKPQPVHLRGSKRHSANGGNGNGQIDQRDAVFAKLRLWRDTNHNGVSETDELHPLSALNVASLDLAYKASKKTDANGNQFGYRAKVKNAQGEQLGRWAWDVYLARAL